MAIYGPVRHQKNIIWTEASDFERGSSIIRFSSSESDSKVLLVFVSCCLYASDIDFYC